MKVEIYVDGRPVSIQSVGLVSDGDIVILSKNMIKGATMATESFDDLFYSFINGAKTYEEAYEKAENIHEELFETRRYSSFDSYRTTLCKRLK